VWLAAKAKVEEWGGVVKRIIKEGAPRFSCGFRVVFVDLFAGFLLNRYSAAYRKSMKTHQHSRSRFVLSGVWTGLFIAVLLVSGSSRICGQSLRAPAVPLVACDPYFSIWSPADRLADADTVHWTGKPHRLRALVRVDGQVYRLMGKDPEGTPALEQVNTEVLPTRTLCTFEGNGIRCVLTFMTPALPDDLMIYSRPVTYVTCEVSSKDQKRHSAQLYVDAGAEISVNTPDQVVKWAAGNMNKVTALAVGSVQQAVLAKRGDDLRIDWGFFHLAAAKNQAKAASACSGQAARLAFASDGSLPPNTSAITARPSENDLVLAMTFDFGRISAKPETRFLVLAYDDGYSIQYFRKNLRPYWRRSGDDASVLLEKSIAEYAALSQQCADFDARLMADLTKTGGDKYARICALAYRQCHAANKVVADDNGQPLMFPKENFSNGCIGTVDILYPMGPQFLLLSPSLTKAMLVPILDYSMSSRWRWPFAPHDLGQYPHANGQVYGGGERTEENQMPVEETGNMLLLLGALARVEGTAEFCAPYWPVLVKWADYLQTKGFDPENQLCTDDFAGHLAHNVNLSVKAICGLGAFSQLCAMRGEDALSRQYSALAREYAAKWVKEAADGDHYKLAFDRSGSWSQKYNLVWDRILGLNLFPSEVSRKEMEYYLKIQNTYGLPLDNRKDYTKLDWILWTATLTGDRGQFESLVDPVYRFLNETPSRVPMTDWYDTKTGKMVGFRARSVVGGVFLAMLYDRANWQRWASQDKTRAGEWAPLPKPREMVVVVPPSRDMEVTWKYTTNQPVSDWFKTDFKASGWQEGLGGFGSRGTPGGAVRTEWKTSDVWLRREFALPQTKIGDLRLLIHHDEDAEVYINGVRVARLEGFTTDYTIAPLEIPASSVLRQGRNVMAIHCRQTSGGQYIDAGIVELVPER
jgi:hypothetical protein